PHGRADPRRGRQPAHVGIARHQHHATVHHHVRLRQRHGGARRRRRRRIPRPRPPVSAEISGDVPDRRRGRRAWPHHRRVLRVTPHRRARLHAEGIPATGRHGVHLRLDDPAAAMAATGAVRTRRMSIVPVNSDNPAAHALAVRHRFRWWEALPWLLALAFYFAFPRYLGFGTELLITILFAISLDLALGYAGIVTLGHAA